MPETPDSEESNPYCSAVVNLLDDDLREELRKAEASFQMEIEEGLTAKGRATALLRLSHYGRPFEHLETELETEHKELIAYHRSKLVKKIRWVLEAWKVTDKG
jgi:hypothetical protein